MRVRITLVSFALCLFASNAVHAASGIAMRWGRCYGEGGENNKNFACNTNAGSEKLVLSFVPSAEFTQWSGIEVIVDGMSSSAVAPSWWMLRGTGQCRNGSLTANVIADPASTPCTDLYQGLGAGGIGTYTLPAFGYPNRSRLAMVFAVPPEYATTLNTGTEYFACNVVINHAKSVGTGACAGCAEPFCLLLGSINLTRASGLGNQKLTEHLGPNSAVVGWQGASPVPFYHPPVVTAYTTIPGYWDLAGCTLPTPTNQPTWGAIKSLYR